MCTLAAKKLDGRFFIFKNRDLRLNAKTKVIKEGKRVKKLLIVDDHGHCEGLNEYGLGIIDATLKPYPLVKYLDSSKTARRILNQKNIEDALEIIRRSQNSVNKIISDGRRAFIVEKTPTDFALTKIISAGVITNLSIKLSKKNGSNIEELRSSAQARYLRARKIIKGVDSFKKITKFLADKQGYPLYSICRGRKSLAPTRCSFIYDLSKKTIFFCPTSPDRGRFKEYRL